MTSLVGAFLLTRGAQTFRWRSTRDLAAGGAMLAGAVVVGGSTIWLGAESPTTLAVAGAGIALLAGMRAFGSAPRASLAKA